MKKLMILGASDLQLPAILKCKELNIQTCVLDYNPDAVGKEFSDIFYNISTLDKKKVAETAKVEKIDGIITLASDRPIPIVSNVAEQLNLVSISGEAALMATNKGIMRKALQKGHVPSPKFFLVHNIQEFNKACSYFSNKFITKPADNSGSRGIYLVNSKEEEKKAFYHSMDNSINGCILVEEFMDGPEVSVETFTLDGIVHIIAITDKITTGAPYFVEMGHTQPSQLNEDAQKKIIEVAKAAVSALKINNGPSHVEIKVTSAGPKIVEVGARLGGDCITTHLTPLSTGVDLVKLTILNALGIKHDIEFKEEKVAIIRYFDFGTGVLKNIHIPEFKEKSIIELRFTKYKGDKVGDIKCSNDRMGYVIIQGDSLEQVEEEYQNVLKQINVDIEKEAL